MPVVNREVVLPVPTRARLGADHRAVRARGLARPTRSSSRPLEDAPLRVTERRRDPRGRRRGGHRARADRLPLGRLPRRVGARGRIPAAPASSSPSTASRADTITWGPKLMALSRASDAVPGVDDVFSALSDPTRREVLRSVAQRPELTASRLAGELPITRQAVAKHLAALQQAGLVEPRREGRETRYTLTPAPLVDAMGWMARGRRGLGPAPGTSGRARPRVGEAACPPLSSPAPPAASAAPPPSACAPTATTSSAFDLEPTADLRRRPDDPRGQRATRSTAALEALRPRSTSSSPTPASSTSRPCATSPRTAGTRSSRSC